MLRCKDGSLYTGSTTDVEKRFLQHANKKGAKYTRSKGVVERVYTEEHVSKSAAFKREYQIKKLRREKKLLLISNLSG
jgi:predicted GIY-YIG superfamily endonuclease